MSNDAEPLLTRSALELAAMVRSGDATARELTEAALRQAEARKDLNAFTYMDADAALKVADAIRPGDPRPFAGVPLAIKELCAVAGQPHTMGSHLFGHYRAPHDAYVVRRFREAGFVLIGRTSSPEFGIVPSTDPKRFGSTRNPWNTALSPGGSSGGAGAAVAAGILPVAHGSDGGGSIRIPSACCGLVGLKASRGRISHGPDIGDSLLATDGVLTRTVADSAAILDVLAGYEIGDATWTPPPVEPFATTAARPPRKLRIAYTTISPVATEVDPLCANAVGETAKLLAELGHEVEEMTPPGWTEAEATMPLFATLYAAGIASGVRWGEAVAGRAATPEDVEAMTWGFYQMGTTLSGADLLGAIMEIQRMARQLIGFFSDYDLLLQPSLGQRPQPLGWTDVNSYDWLGEFQKCAAFTPFTAIWNTTGQPAISVPLYHGEDGLPLGVQFAGPPLGEGLLLSVAAQLEAAHPWRDRRPPTV